MKDAISKKELLEWCLVAGTDRVASCNSITKSEPTLYNFLSGYFSAIWSLVYFFDMGVDLEEYEWHEDTRLRRALDYKNIGYDLAEAAREQASSLVVTELFFEDGKVSFHMTVPDIEAATDIKKIIDEYMKHKAREKNDPTSTP
ncbi:MAG: hypothetical protein GY861_01215 [bacterium]|nr:hypothetical protein [bacterium]